MKRSSGERRSPRTRSVAVATGILVLGLAPLGVAKTGDALREGQRNGTASKETQVFSRINAVEQGRGGYGVRVSNFSRSGGALFSGCYANLTVTGQPHACLRAENLRGGLAFKFDANRGNVAGEITVGGGGDSKKPFTTNATGLATGLNADRVDGVGAEGLRTRWFLLNEAGQIEEQSGGFSVVDAYQTNANVYVDTGASLAGKGLSATVAAQNKIDQTADGAPDPSFGGEVAVARCQTAALECAPAAAKTPNALVVAPRDSDGSETAAGSRKRVYVVVTE